MKISGNASFKAKIFGTEWSYLRHMTKDRHSFPLLTLDAYHGEEKAVLASELSLLLVNLRISEFTNPTEKVTEI